MAFTLPKIMRDDGALGGALDPFGVIGGLSGQDAAEAAERAGEMQAGAMVEAARIGERSAAESRALLAEQLGLTREGFAPFLATGREALPTLREGIRPVQGETLEGLEANLAAILGGDAFQSLLGERQRAAEGALSTAGLTRSGAAVEEMAQIPTDLAFQLENMLFGRGRESELTRFGAAQDLANLGLSAAAQTGGQTSNLTQAITNAISQGAQSQMAGITGPAQARAGGLLGGTQAQQQGLQNLLNLGVAAFSDPRLKENVNVIGNIGPLEVIEWDWRPEFEDTMVNDFPTLGFMSTQVKEHYPEYVHEFAGYDVIEYPRLRERLQEEGHVWQ